MKKLLLFCYALCANLWIYAQATDLVVDCQTPGWLSSMINYGDQQTVKNLKVTGYINTTDLQFVGSLTQLSLTGVIDLSDVTIVDGVWNGSFLIGKLSSTPDFDYHIQKLVLPKNLTNYYEAEGTHNTEIDTLVFDTKINKTIRTPAKISTFRRKIGLLIIGESVDSIETVGEATKVVRFPRSLRYIGNYACQGRADLSKWNIEEFPSLEEIGYCAFTYSGPGYKTEAPPSNSETLPDSIIFPNIKSYCMSSFDYKKGMHIFFGEHLEGILPDDGVSYSYPFHSTIENVSFHFKTMTPPRGGMPNCYPSCTIYVPKGAKQAYIESGFSKFTIIEEKQPLEDIVIDKHEMRMEVGEMVQLFALPIPDNADDPTIIWSSDNDSVASVSQNGIVTAKVAGYANIIAMSADESIRDTCRVTVNAHAESIFLSSSSIVLTEIGETHQLEATIIPENAVNKTVSWKSLNEAICHVTTNGLVIAVDYGTAVVTATTVDGGHTAVCTVKVVHDVETVEMDKHEVTMKAKDMMQLKVNILPDNAYDKTVTWTSSNDSLATVDADGNVKALAVGEVFVKATSNFNDEASDSCRVTIAKRIEVKDSTIIWNDTTFVYTGLSPQPTWKNTHEEYTVMAEIPELEKNVGSWETTVPFAFTDGVDTLVVNVPLRYTITPAPLTIKANDAERFYGEENPEFTFTYEGFVNGETDGVLTQKPVATTTATAESPIGTYLIMVEGAEADNYTIEYVEGTLTVKENPEEVGEDVTDIVTATEVTLKAGENTTLTVSLTTKDTDYIGYQFNLYLPEGISVATDDNGYFLVTEKTGREKVALAVSDGSVLFYTTADKDHDALVSGPLMEIELTADSALDAGNYTVRIERIICATRENKTVSLPSSTVTVTVEKEAEEEVPAVITADDVEGEPASRITLPVFLNNAKDINAFYFDLTLPKGIAVAEEKNGQFIATFTGDYGDTMLLSCLPWDASMGTTNNVNTWRFIATPKDNGVFHANAGRVMNVTLEVDKDMAGGVYTARMNVVKLVEANDAAGSRIFGMMHAPTSSAAWTSYSTITIKTQKQGDVNGDNTIDVADIATVISVMAGNATLGGVAHYADVNGDGTVDVADIAAIIDTMAANARRKNIE